MLFLLLDQIHASEGLGVVGVGVAAAFRIQSHGIYSSFQSKWTFESVDVHLEIPE